MAQYDIFATANVRITVLAHGIFAEGKYEDAALGLALRALRLVEMTI